MTSRLFPWPRSLMMFALLLTLAGCALEMKSLTRAGALSPPADKCGECHVDIYREWQASPHARAFTNPEFTAATLNRQVASCLPCHAPATIFSAGGRLTTRKDRRDEGVNCITCHLNQGKQHGPCKPGPMTPHATEVDPGRYHDATLCGICHTGAYQAWQGSRSKDSHVKTCQECHMPAVRRKMTQATGLLSKGIVALHKEHNIRRHTFIAMTTPDQRAVAIEVVPTRKARSGDYQIRVQNLLPHGIPEGDFGFRKVVLTAELLDGTGRPISSATMDFYKDLGTQLKPGQILKLRLAADRSGLAAARARVRLARMRANGSVASIIADETKDLRNEGTSTAP